MTEKSPQLQELLLFIRQHPAFPELTAAVMRPRVTTFKLSMKDDVGAFGAQAIFASGKREQHDLWLSLLHGEPTRASED